MCRTPRLTELEATGITTMMTCHKPQDRYKAVWLIFFILGLGTLLPWNFFMTATMYFKSCLGPPQNNLGAFTEENRDLLATPSSPPLEPSFLSSIFNNVMTICAMLPLLVFTCLNSFLCWRIPQALRILGNMVAILLMFALTAILVEVDLDPMSFFTVTMIQIVIINSSGAILQGSLFGLAGLLPASYTVPLMSGQGLAGIFTAVAVILAISSGSELEQSASRYFITACVVTTISVLCYLVLSCLKFYRYYQQAQMEALGEWEVKMDFILRGPGPQRSGREVTLREYIFKERSLLCARCCKGYWKNVTSGLGDSEEIQNMILCDSTWLFFSAPGETEASGWVELEEFCQSPASLTPLHHAMLPVFNLLLRGKRNPERRRKLKFTKTRNPRARRDLSWWTFSCIYLVFPRDNSATSGEEGGMSKPSTQTSCERTSIIAFFKQIWVLALSVSFIFIITICVFPAVTAEVQSTIARTSDWKKYFILISCFFTFNVFDWAGRSLTTLCMWPTKDSRWQLPALVVARIVFVPLLMLCNIHPRKNLPVIFHHDAWFIIFITLFAFSNGYLASLCMCFAPKKVKPSEAEAAGTVMVFFLALGLALGTLLSFLLRVIV
ncbi:equilibrative nucleoside transporter 1-like [Notamacropus eugenii]|uniref:equilibrative nucleoside transporter 1-like n=1 Tax=Notamacropus eugenii TaxID=9315 RepID=UPI003B67137D